MNNFKQLQSRHKLLQEPFIRSCEARAENIHPSMLSYWKKKGYLEQIERGLYKNNQIKTDISFEWEDLINTVLAIPHGVVTGISALALYGITDEIPRAHWIAIPNNTSTADRINAKILRLRNHEVGIIKIKIDGVEIPIYSIERTIVDAFRFLSIETAIKALKEAFAPTQMNRPDIKKINEYAKKLRVKIGPYLLMVTT